LRQPHVERHLAALEAGDADAGARLGALLAAAGGLAEPRADSAADANARLTRALVIPEIVQFHVFALAFAFVALSPPFQGRGGSVKLSRGGGVPIRPHPHPSPEGEGNYAASSTCTRCATLRTWPSTSGVPSTSTVRPILLRPRPTRVARCVLSRRIGEPVWVILIFAIEITPPPLRPGPRLRRHWRRRDRAGRRPSCRAAATRRAGTPVPSRPRRSRGSCCRDWTSRPTWSRRRRLRGSRRSRA